MSKLRQISRLQLKAILNEHNKWLNNKSRGQKADLSQTNLKEIDLSQANLRYANLSDADLSGADLRWVDLSGADLSGADLSDADLGGANLYCTDLISFHFQRHQAFFTFDGTLRIGCLVMPVSEWVLGFKEIGGKWGYTRMQMKAYRNFIKLCANMMK